MLSATHFIFSFNVPSEDVEWDEQTAPLFTGGPHCGQYARGKVFLKVSALVHDGGLHVV